MENRKLTADIVVEWELQSLGEAIGNCLALNDDFLDRYCGERVATQLRRIPEKDRENILAQHIGEGFAVGGYYSLGESSIVLPVGEVEYQFEGNPEDTFADVNEWTINGNLAYTGLDAAEFPIDVESLAEEIDEFLSGDCPSEFVESYLECALWSSTDNDGRPLDDNFDVDDIDRETRKTAETECADFWRQHGWICSRDARRAGFDFWLTRNHHGAGFWDGHWRETFEDRAIEKRLTNAAHEFGSVNLYVGDDGRIHG
jgi:hypothetical protein